MKAIYKVCFAALVAAGLAGCAPHSISALKEKGYHHHETWLVQHPIDKVHRDYIEAANNRFAYGWIVGYTVTGNYYGEVADVTIGHGTGIKGMHFEMEAQEGDTLVRGYIFRNWASSLPAIRDVHAGEYEVLEVDKTENVYQDYSAGM